MISDRELLELAAKAAGVGIDDWNGDTPVEYFWDGDPQNPERNYRYWNPLTDDGDALRLAVKLHMFDAGHFKAFRLEETRANPARTDCEITRRAIVRAAAEIGRRHD
jgi:hypothetical protein